MQKATPEFFFLESDTENWTVNSETHGSRRSARASQASHHAPDAVVLEASPLVLVAAEDSRSSWSKDEEADIPLAAKVSAEEEDPFWFYLCMLGTVFDCTRREQPLWSEIDLKVTHSSNHLSHTFFLTISVTDQRGQGPNGSYFCSNMVAFGSLLTISVKCQPEKVGTQAVWWPELQLSLVRVSGSTDFMAWLDRLSQMQGGWSVFFICEVWSSRLNSQLQILLEFWSTSLDQFVIGLLNLIEVILACCYLPKVAAHLIFTRRWSPREKKHKFTALVELWTENTPPQN